MTHMGNTAGGSGGAVPPSGGVVRPLPFRAADGSMLARREGVWLEAIMRAVTECGRFTVTWLWLLRPDGRFELLSATGLDDPARDWQLTTAFSCGCLGKLVTGGLTGAEQIAECPRLAGLVGARGGHAVVPLRSAERAIGLLGCGRADAPLEDQDLALLTVVGSELSTALQQAAELEQQAADAGAERELLHQQAVALLKAGSEQEAAQATTALLLRQRCLDGVRVYRRRTDGDLVCLAQLGLPARGQGESRTLAAERDNPASFFLDRGQTRLALPIGDGFGYLVIERLAGLDACRLAWDLVRQVAAQLAMVFDRHGGCGGATRRLPESPTDPPPTDAAD